MVPGSSSISLQTVFNIKCDGLFIRCEIEKTNKIKDVYHVSLNKLLKATSKKAVLKPPLEEEAVDCYL